MALRALPVLLLLTALAFAGCAGKDSPAEDTADGTLGGAPGPAASDGPAAAPEAVVATRAAEDQPIHVEGTTSTGGCAYAAGQGACRYENGDHSFLELEGGEPSRFAGTLAWTATTPYSQEMSVYVLHKEDDGYYWFDDASPIRSGPSPLAFDFDLHKYNGTQVAFGVSNVKGEGALVAWASAGVSQDFTLDGTFTSIVLRA